MVCHKIPFVILTATLFCGFATLPLASQVAEQTKQYPGDHPFVENIFLDTENISGCTGQFMQALSELVHDTTPNEIILDRLFTDVIDIVYKEEYQAWQQYASNREKVNFIITFWQRRDPTWATPANERLFEHYRRLLEARKRYGNNSARTYDHRGAIYVRYGQPDETYREEESATGNANTQTRMDDLGFRPSVETWFYYSFTPAVSFDFAEGKNGYTLFSQLDYGVQLLTDEEKEKAFREMLRKRKALSPAHQAEDFELNTLRRFERKRISDFEVDNRRMAFFLRSKSFEMQQQHRKLPMVVSTVLSDLPFVQDVSYFENDDKTSTYVISFGLEQNAVQPARENLTQRIILSAVIADTANAILASQNANISIKPFETVWGAFQFNVRNNDGILYSEVISEKTKQLGKRRVLIEPVKRAGNVLRLSSILLAKSIFPLADSLAFPSYATISRANLLIVPTPFRKFSLANPVFVFFEIYGLKKGADGSTSFEVGYEIREQRKTGFLDKLNPFKGGTTITTISHQGAGSTTTQVSYVQLDLSELKKGNYELWIRVRDHVDNRSQSAKLALQIE